MPAPTFFRTAAHFRRWLQAHAHKSAELVVGYYKVGSGQPSMGWPDSVDEALCFGWIDGVRKRIDEASYQIRFTPRKTTSIWSAINIAKYEQLVAAGRMTEAGTKAFGHRTPERSVVYAYEQETTAELSADELRTFKRSAEAWQFFERSPPGYRKQLLHWVVRAKRPETRASRLHTLIEACAAGKRLR